MPAGPFRGEQTISLASGSMCCAVAAGLWRRGNTFAAYSTARAYGPAFARNSITRAIVGSSVCSVDRHVPVFRARQAFLEIARGRGRVRGVAAGHDQRRDVERASGPRARRRARCRGRTACAPCRRRSACRHRRSAWRSSPQRPRSRLITEAHGPPRGSAPNGLPSLATSATTASSPFCCTKARCSAKR